MKVAALILFAIVMGNPALAESETRRAGQANGAPSAGGAATPLCIDSGATIVVDGREVNAHQHIITTMENNMGTNNKYNGYRDVFNHFGIGLDEIQKRLVYAETLAMSQECSQHYEYGSLLIASVVQNRINMRGGNADRVLFRYDQFATSFNRYGSRNSWAGGSSEYEQMLCPTNGQVWNMVNRHVDGLATGSIQSPVPSNTTMLYYARHFKDRPTMRPTWEGAPEIREVNGPNSGGRFSPDLVSCVQVWTNNSF